MLTSLVLHARVTYFFQNIRIRKAEKKIEKKSSQMYNDINNSNNKAIVDRSAAFILQATNDQRPHL